MLKFKFNYINLTGLTEAEVLVRAKRHKKEMEKHFYKGVITMQESIDGIIDAFIEHNQG